MSASARHTSPEPSERRDGRWVALRDAHCEEGGDTDIRGEVVEQAETLGDLVAQLEAAGRRRCVIRYVEF